MTAESNQALLVFTGVVGCDVFNCSVPFVHNGQTFMYGNVEKRTDHRCARTSLFREIAPDTFALESSVLSHQVENPHAVVISGEVIMGGTQVIKDKNDVLNCYTDIYRGVPQKLLYFTSGPDRCSHLRVVSLPDSTVGLFATVQDAPNTVRFTTVKSLSDVDGGTVEGAAPLKDPKQFFGRAQTVLITQALPLPSGDLGCIALTIEGDTHTAVACVVDRQSHSVVQCKKLADRSNFPSGTPKTPQALGKLFPAGIVTSTAGKCQLYCGVDDMQQYRIAVPYPF